MYKCTDCGQEYSIKPEYCDCGNNNFENITPEEAPQAVPKVKTPAAFKAEIPKPKYERPFFDIPSLAIFFTCIILSILSIIFIGKDSTVVEQQDEPEIQTVKETIPSFASIWKETAVRKTEATAPVVTQTVQQTAKPKAVKTVKPVQQQTPVKKQATVNQPVSKPAAQTASMTEEQKQQIVNRLTSTQTPRTSAAKTETSKTVTKVDTAAQQKELQTYKAELRDKIGKNINFAGVIGDGNCAITFKIDSSGNLINRSFSVQSSNNTLNDAVYSAMMRNPTFKTPPDGYKNETLTLSVQIYNGNFEVTLK